MSVTEPVEQYQAAAGHIARPPALSRAHRPADPPRSLSEPAVRRYRAVRRMIQLPAVTTPQADHVGVAAVLRRPGNRSSFRQISSTYGQISSTCPRIIGHMHVTGHIIFAHTSQYACHQR